MIIFPSDRLTQKESRRSPGKTRRAAVTGFFIRQIHSKNFMIHFVTHGIQVHEKDVAIFRIKKTRWMRELGL